MSEERNIRDLTEKELSMLEQAREWGRSILINYGIDKFESEIVPTDLDAIFKFWYEDKSESKSENVPVIYGISTIFGDFLTNNCDCKWKTLVDGFGATFIILVNLQNGKVLEINVNDVVKKRIHSEEPEFGFLNAIWLRIGEHRNGT